MPPRIAPSPAAEEPGQQNAVARLRSSREAQSRLLAERRGEVAAADHEVDSRDQSSTAVHEDATGDPGKREADAVRSASVKATVGSATTGKKVKLVLLCRLPLSLEPDLAGIAAQDGVTMEYVLGALAREGRERLRNLAGEEDIRPLTAVH